MESWTVSEPVYPTTAFPIDGHLWWLRWPERTAWPRTSRMVCCVIRNQSHGYVATSRTVSCQTDANPLMIGWDSRNVKGKSQLVEKHGERGARTWRKLHLAVDPSTGEILASELTSNEEGDASQVGPLLGQISGPLASVTADGAYDGEPVYRAVSERQPDPPVAVVIPPRSTAVPSTTAGTTPSQRDGHIQMIRNKGRMAWQKTTGYGRRSHAETAMFRYKALIGSRLGARTLPAQRTETKVGCSVLNRMARLGMPVSQRVR